MIESIHTAKLIKTTRKTTYEICADKLNSEKIKKFVLTAYLETLNPQELLTHGH